MVWSVSSDLFKVLNAAARIVVDRIPEKAEFRIDSAAARCPRIYWLISVSTEPRREYHRLVGLDVGIQIAIGVLGLSVYIRIQDSDNRGKIYV